MTDFTQTAVSMSAKREITQPITDRTAFEEIVASFLSDQTMGLSRKEKTNTSYTAKIIYCNAAGDDVGKISMTANSGDTYEEELSFLKGNEATEIIGGIGGTAFEDSEKALWNIRISCERDSDTFTVSFNRDSITVSGYAKAETLAAVESWADTIDALA